MFKKRENAGKKHTNNPNAFIECSNTMDDAYETIHDYNSSRKRNILIIFNDMIVDIMSNKKFQAIIKKLFIRIKINKSEFDELTSDIYYNQNNKDFKITINKKTYDLKNAKKCWTKITKSKVSKNEAKRH